MYSLFTNQWNAVVEHSNYSGVIQAARRRWDSCDIEEGIFLSRIRGYDNEIVGYIVNTQIKESENAYETY